MASVGGTHLLRPVFALCDPKPCAKQDCLKAFQIGVASASNHDTLCTLTPSLCKRQKLTSVSRRRKIKLLDCITEHSERKAVPRSHTISQANGNFRDSSSRWHHDGLTLLTDYYDADGVNGQAAKEEETLLPSSSNNVREETQGSVHMGDLGAKSDHPHSTALVSLASAGQVLGRWRQNMEMAWGGAAPDPVPASVAREGVHEAHKTTSVEAGESSEGAGGDPTLPTSMPASGRLEEGAHLRESEISPEETQGGANTTTEDSGGGERREGTSSSEEEELNQWDIFRRFWNNSAFVRFRMSLSLANLTMAIPTFLARALPLFAHVTGLLPFRESSLHVLAPLLFGGGIVFKSVSNNLGYVLPRLGMAVAMLWVLWGLNSFLQEGIGQLGKYSVVDPRLSNGLVLMVELTVTAIAVVTSLSSLGVRISSLVMPFFIAVALAGKDVWHNYFAGFFLFAAQPFKPGDTLALTCGSDIAPPSIPSQPHTQLGSGWFEGVCESVDLRYTVLRNGRYRLMVPNLRFVQKEFLVLDSGGLVKPPNGLRSTKRKKDGGKGVVVGGE